MAATYSKLPWALEVLFLCVSIAFLGALVGVLQHFDQRQIFDHNPITLNTIVAILAAAARAGILVVIANCIGQWKWILFSGGRHRRLLDFERLDEATRGPMGSVRLLFSPKITKA